MKRNWMSALRSQWFAPVVRTPAETRRLTREMIIFGVVLLVLAFAGDFAGKLERQLPRSVLSHVMAVIEWSCVASAAAAIVVLMPLRMKETPASPALVGRTWLSILLVFAGLKAGCRYPHLCDAGSGLVEGGALFGTPIVIGVIMFCVKRLSISVPLAASVIAIVRLLARPYLDYVHGN